MLPFVGFVRCMLVLSIAFVVVEPLAVGRVDSGSKTLCAHTVLDADEDLSLRGVRYHRILIQDDFDSTDEYRNDSSELDREFLDESAVADDEESDDRSNREWKKIRRYIKRQLKVPKRYLKKIVRKLGVTGTLRSAESEGLISLVSSPDNDDMNNILARANGRFNTKRLVVVDDAEPVEYFAVIAAPAGRMYQSKNE